MIEISKTKTGWLITQTAYSPYYSAMLDGEIHGRKIHVSAELAAPYVPVPAPEDANIDWDRPSPAAKYPEAWRAGDYLAAMADQRLEQGESGVRLLAKGYIYG